MALDTGTEDDLGGENISKADGITVTEENKLAGTGFIEAFDGMVTSINNETDSESERALGITFDTIGALSSVVAFAADPLGSILAAGVGWLMEHVDFLREALNQLMGDPKVIQQNVEDTKAKAAEIAVLAEDHRSGLATYDGWEGGSSDSFRASMELLTKELEALSKAVNTKAKVVAVSGTLVIVLRDIVRDLIAELIGSLLGKAIIAAAAAIPTAGASVAYFIGSAVAKAVALGAKIGAKISKVIAALGRLAGRTVKLDEAIKALSKGWDRFENVADVAEVSYEGYKAGTDVDKKSTEAIEDNKQRKEDQVPVDAANNEAKAKADEYKAAKDRETERQKDLETANKNAEKENNEARDANKTANKAADDVKRAADEVNKAAKSGDQDKFDAAKEKYDAAKDRFDDTKIVADRQSSEATAAAGESAKAAKAWSAAADESYQAQQDTKTANAAADKAADEFAEKHPTGGGSDDPERTAAQTDLKAKSENAKAASEDYEKANADFSHKNAAASEANYQAAKTGSDADIKAAEKASEEAKASSEKLKSAGENAKATGDEANSSYEDFKSKYDNKTEEDPLTKAKSIDEDVDVTDFGNDAFLQGFDKK